MSHSRSHLYVLAVAILSASASPLAGQTQDSVRQAEQYHLAQGLTYNQHAGDTVRVLKKYAAAGKTVPSEVVAEHIAVARSNTEAAKKSFSKLGAAAAKKPELAKRVAQIQAWLDQLSQQLNQFEAQTSQEEIDSGKVLAHTAAITQQLIATDAAARQADQDFYNADSANYYTTGAGHFED